MLKTRSSDRRQEMKSEMKGTTPHSIVKNSAAAVAITAATNNTISTKISKRTVEIVKPKIPISSQRVEVIATGAKPKRFDSIAANEISAKLRKPNAKTVELMEVNKLPNNAPSIKVEIDLKPTTTAPSKNINATVPTVKPWNSNVSKLPAVSQRRNQKIGKSMIIDTLEDSKPILTSYQKQIQQQEEALHQVEEQVNRSSVIRNKLQKRKAYGKKLKTSPKKSLLREQLKLQLETQRELLRVQQEIFEKANKAQNDIFKLISVLDDDDDDSDGEEENVGDAEEEADVEVEEHQEEEEEEEEEVHVETEVLVKKDEETEIELDTELLETEEIVETETIDTEEISDEKCGAQPSYEENQMDLVVVLQSDEGVEEFELYEICENADGTADKPKDEGDQLHFEIIEGDDQDIHCRVVNKPEKMVLDSNNETDPLSIKLPRLSMSKHPIHVDLPDVNVPRATKPKLRLEKSDVLNKSNLSEKQINEFIQDMIHAAKPTSDGKFKCSICNEVVSNRYSLGPHVLRVHSKHKSKVCPFCDRAFTCTGDLTRHIRIHTNSKPFKCTYADCTYAFRASGDLHKHMRRHQTAQDGSNRRFTCELCDRSFERNYDLKRHKMTHNRHEEGVGYQCEYCPKTFVRKDQHRAHTYRHLGIKPYKCPDCDRSFGDFSNCSKHIKQNACKNTGDSNAIGRFTCDTCMKRFKSKAGIKLHVTKCFQQNALCKELTGE